MPTYTLQYEDGKEIDVESPSPPSESEISQYYQQAFLSAVSPAKPPLTTGQKIAEYGVALPIRFAGGLSPGGPVGALVGAGTELGAEVVERAAGIRPSISGKTIAAEGAVGAIPFGKFGKAALKGASLGKKALVRGGQAAAFAPVATTVRTGIEEQRLPTAGELAVSTGIGAATGGALGGVERGLEKLAVRAVKPGDLPQLNTDQIGSNLLGDYAVKYRAIATGGATPMRALSKLPGIGKIIEPRGAGDEVITATAIHADDVQEGTQRAALFEQIESLQPKPFAQSRAGWIRVQDKGGQVKDVPEADVLENPQKYALTLEQRAWWRRQHDTKDQFIFEARKHGIETQPSTAELEKSGAWFNQESGVRFYWPRTFRKGDLITEEVPIIAPTGGRVGGKVASQRARLQKTALDSAEAAETQGMEMLDAVGSLSNYVRQLTKRAADTRLVEAMSPRAETMEARIARYMAQGLDKEKAKLRAQALTVGEGRVGGHPAFQSLTFDKQTANALNDALNYHRSAWMQTAQNINIVSRNLSANLDLSHSFIQTLPLMGVNPYRWGRVQVNAIRALFSPKFAQQFYARHAEELQQAIGERSGIALRPQVAEGTRAGEIAGRIGFGKFRPFEASGRGFQVAVDAATLELRRAFAHLPQNQAERLQLAEAIDNLVGRGRTITIGLSKRQADRENLLLFASHYTRASANVIASLFDSKNPIAARVAWRSLGALAAVGMTGMYLAGKQMGLSDEEIASRIADPSRGDWLTLPIKRKDGSIQNIGIGGSVKSIIRLLGNSAKTLATRPENFLTLQPDKNPLARFARGKASPLAGTAIDGVTGTDFLGQPINVPQAAALRAIPFSLQEAAKGGIEAATGQPLLGEPSEQGNVVTDTAASALGLTSFPERPNVTLARQREAASQKAYGTSFEKLSPSQQAVMVRQTGLRDVIGKRTPRAVEMGIKADEARAARVGEALGGELMDKLVEEDLAVGGFEPYIRVGQGVNAYKYFLTEPEMQSFIKFYAEAARPRLSRLLNNPRFKDLQPEAKKKLVNDIFEDGRARARRIILAAAQKRTGAIRPTKLPT